jgi:LPXTG-motif cell wall-anchored protein
MFTNRKEYMDKRYNSPGRRAIVAGLMAATLLSNVSGIVKSAYAETPTTAQIKTTNVDLAKLKLQKLNLNMNDYEVVHKDPTTQINTFDSSAYFSQPGNGWAPTSIIQFSSQIDKSKDHIVIDNPVEILFKNTGYYFGRQTNVRMKVNRVYYDAIDYSGTSYASTSTRERRMSKPGDEVMFAELDNAAGENGVVQFTNYNFYTSEPNAAPYVHPVQGSKQNTLNSWYTMRADVTYTIEYADGTQADMKLVVPVGDLDVISYVNKAKGDGAGQNEMFELPNADSQASKIIFNRNFAARLTRPSDNNGTMVINPPANSIGGNSLDWMYNTTGATIRSRSNSLTFTSGSADASGTDFGVYVEHPAVDPVKKVDKTRIASYQDGKLVYTIQSTIPKVGTDVIDDIDEFSIDDLLDNRLKNVTVKGVYVTDSEDADPSTADWRKLPPNKYTIDTTGQKLKVNIDKSQLGHKQVKVIFETDTLATDLSADTSIINNQATVHTDDVPSKSNVTRTQPTYKFDHEFVAEDGSQLPGDVTTLTPGTTEDITPGTTVTPNLFTVPDASKPDTSYEGYDASKVQVKDDAKNGVWSFKSWDKANETLDKKNGRFIGTWAFTPNAYAQTYKYVMSDGSAVPAEVNATLPARVGDLVDGTNVTAANPLAPAAENVMQPTDKGYDASKTQVKLPHGYANFVNWDIPTATINRADVLHTGTWEYHENLWGKSHEFKSNTDKALPAGITAITPATVSDQYHDGDTINADSFQIPAENVVPSANPLYDASKVQYLDEHGVWTADDTWDKSNVVVDHADTHFVRGWTYQANSYAKNHKFESVDGTPLPTELTAITPASSNGYEDGTVLNADTFEVPAANKVDASDKLYQEGKTQFRSNDGMGVWTAEPAWDKHDVTVDRGDVTFTLKWSYSEYKFGKQHKFVAEDGSELPQGIKDITPASVENQYKPNEVITADGFEVPADKKPADGTEYADASKKQFVDTERDGVWEFVSWDKDNITVDHSDDNLFTGTWKFMGYSHKATYEFVSGTPGKELPKSIVDMTPTDPAKYTKGTEVPAKSEFEKTVKDEDNDGTWTFKSYDHDKQTIEKSDIKFVGTWEFTPNTYPVDYEFKSTDPKRELPKVVKDKLPKDDKTYITKTPVDAQKIPNDPVYDPELDIDWTFNKWDSPKKTIEREGIKFTGEWTPKQREYKVTYKFTSGTPGKELPKEVTDLLPKDDKSYVTGSKVKSNKPSKTEVKVDGGTWKFKEFPPELTIDKKDGEFAGEWVFEADPAPTPEPQKPAAKPVPKTGDATTVAPAVGGIAAIMTSILAFFGIKRKSDD